MTITKAFKIIIKQRMAGRKMTAYRLAKEADIPQTTAYDFCNEDKAEQVTDTETANKIADAVGYKLSTAIRLAEGLRKCQLEDSNV